MKTTTLRDRLKSIADSHASAVIALDLFFFETTRNMDASEERLSGLREMVAQELGDLPDGFPYSKDQIRVTLQNMLRREQVAVTFPGLLMRMAFIYRVALFDAFFMDLLQAIMANQPNLLKDGKKTLTHREAIELSETGSLLEYIAQKELHDFSYASVQEQSDWIDKKFNIPLLPDEDMARQVSEVMARRNLLVHANGIVNRKYLSIVKDSNFSVGDQLSVDKKYYYDCHTTLFAIATYIFEALSKKFCGEVLILTLSQIYIDASNVPKNQEN